MILHYYDYFYRVAITGNITKAAQELYITQPALSKSISNLEELMGCQLFIRTTKGVKLTAEGEILFESVKNTYDILNEATYKIENLRRNESGEIIVGSGDDLFSYFLIPAIKRFYTKYPNIVVNVISGNSETLTQKVLQKELDFGIVNKRFDNQELEYYSVITVQEILVVGSKFQSLAGNGPVSFQQLKDYPFVLLSKKAYIRSLFDEYVKKNNVSINAQFEAGSTSVLLQLARDNLGIAVVTKNMAQKDLDRGELFEIPLQDPPRPRDAYLVWKKNRKFSPAAQRILRYLRENQL